MKDLKTYIESGILELYVLGDLSKEKMLEVERMAIQHPEIRGEVDGIENALLGYAKSNAIDPSESMRKRVLNSLETNPEEENPVRPLNPSTQSSVFYKYAFAASLALLLVSIVLLINLNNKLKDSNTQLAVLQSDNQKFSNRVNYIDEELKDTRNALAFYQNPSDYKLIKLKGSERAPAASMTVAFSSNKQEVMIDLSSLKMPSNDEAHQYQLWALVDGKPVDLGVFDSTDDGKGMKKMKSIKGAQAFAVTLEPRGGSINPTMDQMMAIGNI